MKIRNLCLSAATMALVLSCQKEDDPNNYPVIKDQIFNVLADITPSDPIGMTVATDADGDTLSYRISQNDDGLFEIANDGQLRLAQGKTFDLASYAIHEITITVSDGKITSSAQIAVKVTPVDFSNVAPKIENQSFNTIESIDTSNKIGLVQATDANQDELKFSIINNDNDLFHISDKGRISLAEGKSLNYEEASQHIITVGVSDNEYEATANITIHVRKDKAPVAEPQEFNVVDNIKDSAVIGSVLARDPEGKEPSFTIAVNDDNLFKISKSGELRLDEGKQLNFDSAEQHSIMVTAFDGHNHTDIPITIIVEKYMEE
ncbi:cadherin domain-containing protein [Flagellimonas beolgyonensis]|uniref:cadherin domain-containing protein n=1 Tax=Flagellimonas beolgyonensis TaxID=864064 RepID=UPI000F8F21AA|nr:cadherin domain-containing protein [Allomuricauda beolgyonensis]